MKIPIKIGLRIVNILLGIIKYERRVECSEQYKKYFGEDYEIVYDKGYSLMISNHTGWIVYYIYFII
jgi:lysophosphatidylcholine acyltransferase/lyso-PAF acetyltransferase